ncbi:MAG: hypothetical protein AVDCRST_MAG01-01-4065, partial [uncultured Rubrobacteraceae bacterium]
DCRSKRAGVRERAAGRGRVGVAGGRPDHREALGRGHRRGLLGGRGDFAAGGRASPALPPKRGRGAVRPGRGGGVPLGRRERPGGRGGVRLRPEGDPAHLEERRRVAFQDAGRHHAGGAGAVLLGGRRARTGSFILSPRPPGHREGHGGRRQVRRRDTAAPGAV